MTDISPGKFARFETRWDGHPDDIDLYQHVPGTRYFDAGLAARFVPREHDDRMVVRCWVDQFIVRAVGSLLKIDRLPHRPAPVTGIAIPR